MVPPPRLLLLGWLPQCHPFFSCSPLLIGLGEHAFHPIGQPGVGSCSPLRRIWVFFRASFGWPTVSHAKFLISNRHHLLILLFLLLMSNNSLLLDDLYDEFTSFSPPDSPNSADGLDSPIDPPLLGVDEDLSNPEGCGDLSWFEDGFVPAQHDLDLDPIVPIARESSLRLRGVALQLVTRRIQASRSARRDAALAHAYFLDDTFLGDGIAVPVPGATFLDPPVPEWVSSLQGLPDAVLVLQGLSFWLCSARIHTLPDDWFSSVFHEAWWLFSTCLHFPSIRSAFEMFCCAPTGCPVEARFLLWRVSPMGPAPPPSLSPFHQWGSGMSLASRDDDLDVETRAFAAIEFLGVATDWVSLLHDVQVDHEPIRQVSFAAWEVLLSVLRIPAALAGWVEMCSDPAALRAAAGLPSMPLVDLPIGTPIQSRRRPRSKYPKRPLV